MSESLTVKAGTSAAAAAVSGAKEFVRMTPEQQKLKEACEGFEAIFVRYLLQKMRQSIPKDGLLPDSQATETYKDMLDSAMAESISKQGSFGLANMLYEQMKDRAVSQVTSEGFAKAQAAYQANGLVSEEKRQSVK